jgi:cellulose synthase/poly-beta-1,6-N-acetylglucosamine synthase-like glycosyltransferase
LVVLLEQRERLGAAFEEIMMVFWWCVLWASLLVTVWVYVIYPAGLWIMASCTHSAAPQLTDLPSVSIILAVYNEERVLRSKLENCMSLDYPAHKLEIIVTSDGSTDGTDAILREFEPQGVRIVISGSRVGKTEAQNQAVALARHEILFFTDATAIHPIDVLRKIVMQFWDPTVGCVSGRAIFRDDRSMVSTGLQMKQKYDRMMRSLQAEVGTLYGATGCVYAVRRALYLPLRADLVSDFVEPLKLLAAGYRTSYEPAAFGLIERKAPNLRLEFSRRSRMIHQGFLGVIHMRELLNPGRNIVQSISLLTQRPLKWLTPLYALSALAASVALADVPVVRALLLLQISFYGIALLAWILELLGRRPPRFFAIPLYFSVMGISVIAGLTKLLRGEKCKTWETVGR